MPIDREAAWAAEIELAIDAEQGLLGSLLTAPEALASAAGIVEPRHFHEPVHRLVYETMLAVRKAGQPCTIGEVRQALGGAQLKTSLGNGVDLGSYLSRLRHDGATSMTYAGYAATVKARWACRELTACTMFAPEAGVPGDRVTAIFDRVDAIRTEVAAGELRRSSIGDISANVLERTTAIAAGSAEQIGITTGFPDLDNAILGYRPGELIVAGGRPGMGKTTFATSSALKACDPRAPGRRAAGLYFALEMGDDSIGARSLADLALERHTSPTHSAIRNGRVDRYQLDLLQQASARLNEIDLEIDYRSSITIAEIEATCLAVQRKYEKQGKRLGLVVVDYLKQVRATDRYRGNRVYEIGEITAGLRDIAKRLGFCVLLLVQLNRSVESRDDHRPTLADLRESGDLENDADAVLLLYRDAYYLQRELQSAEPDDVMALMHKLEMAEHDMQVIVAKNRNGEAEKPVPLWVDIARSAVRSATKRIS